MEAVVSEQRKSHAQHRGIGDCGLFGEPKVILLKMYLSS